MSMNPELVKELENSFDWDSSEDTLGEPVVFSISELVCHSVHILSWDVLSWTTSSDSSS